ncbi:Hemolysin, plasmid [Anatilimnocola aggregata]|uniref:Hemolysin, plasmid n=1 Tax=Anatilimnocola aggregata TaxID=2528021 RepID=A0A517YP14_9BACT|nr:Ig-like domain-containing protein [Anatilimnocola aggregata]QDU31949.1 Hemolysin, plasmid [Anatilimnocola aggregata]
MLFDRDRAQPARAAASSARRGRARRKTERLETARRYFRASLESLEERRLMAIDFLADFNTYQGLGFQPEPTAGQLDSDNWSIGPFSEGSLAFGDTRTSGDFARGLATNNVTTSGLYAFQTSPENRIFGIQPNDTEWANGYATLRIPTGPSIVTDPVISFEYWVRNNMDASTQLSFSYSVDRAPFIPVPALDYTTPATSTSIDFVLAETKTITLTGVTLPAGTTFELRWRGSEVEVSGGGGRDEIGLDNIRVVAGVPNTAPTISLMADQATTLLTPKTVNFAVGDGQTLAGLLNVSATSSNQAVLPNANISLGGSGANRTLTALPTATTGSTIVTVTVTDPAGLTHTEDFTLNVAQGWTISIPQNLSAAQGQYDLVEIPVRINSNGTPASPLFSLDVVLTYDSAVLEIEGVTLGGLLTPPAMMSSLFANFSEQGKLFIGLLTPVGLSTAVNGDVAIVRARIKPTAAVGNTWLNLRNSLAADSGLTIPTAINEGSAPLAPPPTAASNDSTDGLLNILANSPPTLNQTPTTTIDEDAALQTVTLTGITTGGESQSISVTAVTTNGLGVPDTSLIPNPIVSYASPNNTATLQFQPTASSSGTAVVHVLVRDAGPDGVLLTGDDGYVRQQFTVNVTPVNDAPTLNALDPRTIIEDAAQQTVSLSGITAGDGETQTLSVTAASSNPALIPNPLVSYSPNSPTGSLQFTPATDRFGTATITVTVRDAGFDGIPGNADDASFNQQFQVTVDPANDLPTLAVIDPVSAAEDAGTQTVNLSGITAGMFETQVLLLTAVSSNSALIPNPAVSYTSPSSTATLHYSPNANQSGISTITVTVRDAGLDGALDTPDDATFERAFVITVTAVNDVPTLDALSPITIDEDAGSQMIGLAGITTGGGESQTLSVTATSSNPALIPTPNATYTSPNTTASLQFSPVANQSGTATITVTVRDAGFDGILNTGDDETVARQFVVTVNPVNDLPTLDPLSGLVIDEDALQQTINLSGITAGPSESQTLSVTAVSSDPTLIPTPGISYSSPNSSAVLTFTPVANRSGTATITVTVRDAGLDLIAGNADDATFDRQFTVTVNSVNDAPTLGAISPVTVDEDALQQTISLSGISAGGGETQTLSITAVSSNPSLIPTPTIPYSSPSSTATLQFTPAANQAGTSTITVTLRDAGFDGVLNTSDDATSFQQFVITVNPVNDAPTLDELIPLTIIEDALPLTVNLSDITAGPNETQLLSVTAVSSDPTLIANPTIPYSSPSSTASFQFAPIANRSGSATITVTVRDAGLDGIAGNGDDASFSRQYLVTVNPVNDLPTLDAISPLTINEDAGLQTINLTGISAGGGENQPLRVTAVSLDPAVVPTPTINYTQGASTATLSFTPGTNLNGSITDVIVSVRDPGSDGVFDTADDGVIVRPLSVSILPVNDAPTFVPGTNVTVLEDSGATTIGNWATTISPGPLESGSVTFNIRSNSRPDLFASGPVILTNGSLTFTPAANAHGTATITYDLSDDGGTDRGGVDTSPLQSFTITITPVNDAPTFGISASPVVPYNSGAQSLSSWATSISPGATNESGQVLNFTVAVLSNAGLFAVAPAISNTGALTFTPLNGQSGVATLSVVLRDDAGTDAGGSDTSATQTFTITVNPQAPNAPPTINDLAPLTINEDASLQTVGFSGVTAGGETQLLRVTASSSNPTLIADPVVAYTSANTSGSLSFIPTANQSGTSTIIVTLRDAGHDGVLDTADDGLKSTSFLVTVNPVNDAPSFTIGADRTVLEDSGSQSFSNWATSISSGPNETDDLTFNIRTNSRPDLFAAGPTISNSGTLAFTPAANAYGTATITVDLSDNGGTANSGVNTSNTQSFTITITSVNDAPSFAVGANPTVLEDAGPQTLTGWATAVSPGPNEGDVIAFVIIGNTRTDLFSAQPTIAANGTLTFTPAANAHGSATISVKLTDLGGTTDGGVNESAVQTFVIQVTSVNDAPSFAKGADQTIDEDAGAQSITNWATSISPGNGEAGTVAFIIDSNSNPALFAVQPSINATGTLSYAPAAQAHGSATIVIRLVDDGGTASGGSDTSATQAFIITVTPENDSPTIATPADLSIVENSGPQFVELGGITAGGGETQALRVTATSSNPTLVAAPIVSYVSPASTGTLQFASAVDQIGSSTISVTVRDAGLNGVFDDADDGLTTTTFTVAVTRFNHAPVALNGSVTARYNSPVSGQLQATDPDGPALTFAIIAAPFNGTLTSFNAATGEFTYQPQTGSAGVDLFRFRVSDGAKSDTGTMRVVTSGAAAIVQMTLEHLSIEGTPGDDLVIVTPINAGSVRVRTGAVVGIYPLAAGDGTIPIETGDGNDYIVVRNVTNRAIISAGNGDDVVFTGSADDHIYGGLGNDSIAAGDGNNIVWGDDQAGGVDSASGGNDIISTGSGDDTIYAGAGNDKLMGGAGSDVLHAGVGNDSVFGGDGNDLLYGSLGDDTLDGEAGDDIVVGNSGNDYLVGSTGNDIVIGGAGSDKLNGDEDHDLLIGGESNTSATLNDNALFQMLSRWVNEHRLDVTIDPLSSDDNAVDTMFGLSGDDDFYLGSGDLIPDYLASPQHGNDRRFP